MIPCITHFSLALFVICVPCKNPFRFKQQCTHRKSGLIGSRFSVLSSLSICSVQPYRSLIFEPTKRHFYLYTALGMIHLLTTILVGKLHHRSLNHQQHEHPLGASRIWDGSLRKRWGILLDIFITPLRQIRRLITRISFLFLS